MSLKYLPRCKSTTYLKMNPSYCLDRIQTHLIFPPYSNSNVICYTRWIKFIHRMGGVLVTVSHLLALGINHWIGIIRPLQYAATMTRRTAWIVIILSWTCPIIMLFIYFSSMQGKGYLSSQCRNQDFLRHRAFRAFFASCFFAPLLLMILIYLHIFLIVRNHHSRRLRYQVKKVNFPATCLCYIVSWQCRVQNGGLLEKEWLCSRVYSVSMLQQCADNVKKWMAFLRSWLHYYIVFALGKNIYL